MSYLAGLAVGSLVAEKLRKAGSGRGLKLAHGIAGRRRYYDPRLKWDSKYVKKIESYLTKAHGVNDITINKVTGSMLLQYSCSEEAMDFFIKNLPDPDSTGMFRKRIRNVFSRFNRGVYRNTGGYLDLKTSIAGVFLVLGLSRTLRMKQWPGGPQMMWWSYNLMKKAH